MTVSDGCQQLELSASTTIISVNANFTFTPNPHPFPLLIFEDYTFIPEELSGDSYAWSFGDGGNSTDVQPVHSYTIGGDYRHFINQLLLVIAQLKV